MRVLILEDDLWIADLLKQIVLSLRPGARVDCQVRVADAISAWQREPAQLVIADWNLPDGSGTLLLQAIRSQDRDVALVMITARADRSSVLEVRALGINAFISKPFQVPKVLDCLRRLLPEDDEPRVAADNDEDFLHHLCALPDEEIDLPLCDELFQQLRDTAAAPSTLEQLGETWQQDPAVQARLIAAANSSLYNNTGKPCVSLPDAVQRLGAATALNLIQGLALRPVASLQDADLRTLGQDLMQTQLDLLNRVGVLAKACQLDPTPLHSAALLQRMGELAVLQQAQIWRNQGLPLSEQQLQQALRQYSSELANRLKADWRLPIGLRELIGACYGLTPGTSRREPILMRLASVELQSINGQEVQRLRRLAGLS
ncbi:HDOD domain-containing protein [Pseudomonas sp. 8O]|uniref:HDOD domain-containing protein n=1 Tax=Pseudomonas sp. 8O TaxID=2653165 RepID=UPI0012F15227|nr:HDOD domain-containing protein [Pseudomonas sp. 8O]VXC71615.1 DNA-binding response regulator, OmpR family, contains REC and winged-helix (WHTH) domain [Pseudomonas sp. 8O]